MTPEKALARYYTGPYMLAAKAQALIEAEVSKGCDSSILPNPVALEPLFTPIMMPKDIMTLKERPCWTYESPPKPQDIVRYQVWLSPDQPFSWNCFELFVRQLSLASNRMGLEIAGNKERIVITLLCHHSDIPLAVTAFSSKLKFCRLSVATEHLIFDAGPQIWRDIGLCDYFPPPPYSDLLTRPDELHTSPFEALLTALANIPAPAAGIYQMRSRRHRGTCARWPVRLRPRPTTTNPSTPRQFASPLWVPARTAAAFCSH
jgi:hypothetical protein